MYIFIFNDVIRIFFLYCVFTINHKKIIIINKSLPWRVSIILCATCCFIGTVVAGHIYCAGITLLLNVGNTF